MKLKPLAQRLVRKSAVIQDLFWINLLGLLTGLTLGFFWLSRSEPVFHEFCISGTALVLALALFFYFRRNR